MKGTVIHGAYRTLSPEALAAWRVLRDEGGWWTVRELAERLCPDLAIGPAAMRASRWISSLEGRHHVALRQGSLAMRYGVTAACKPPPGESLLPEPLFSATTNPALEGVSL